MVLLQPPGEGPEQQQFVDDEDTVALAREVLLVAGSSPGLRRGLEQQLSNLGFTALERHDLVDVTVTRYARPRI